MSRRFNFSLGRALIAVFLFCVAFVLHRVAREAFWKPAWAPPLQEAMIWEAVFGVCFTGAVGVVVNRTVSFFIAAVIAAAPAVWCTWWIRRSSIAPTGLEKADSFRADLALFSVLFVAALSLGIWLVVRLIRRCRPTASQPGAQGHSRIRPHASNSIRPESDTSSSMRRRFQFGLRRTLIATLLFCVAFVLHRGALAILSTQGWAVSLQEAMIREAAFGVCFAVAVGVIAKRTFSFFIAAVLAAAPGVWFIWWTLRLPEYSIAPTGLEDPDPFRVDVAIFSLLFIAALFLSIWLVVHFVWRFRRTYKGEGSIFCG